MKVAPCREKPAAVFIAVTILRLAKAYCTEASDPSLPGQRVAFGSSGQPGSKFAETATAGPILALSQAICRRRVGAQSMANETLAPMPDRNGRS